MNRAFVIAGLIILAAALVFLNQGIKKSALPDQSEDAQAEQAQKTPIASTPIDPNTVLPSEETVGDSAAAKHHIEVGWVYADNYYLHPEGLTVPIQAVRDYVKSSGGTVSAEIVDLDVPVEDRSPAARQVMDLGLHIDGQTLFGGNLSDAPSSPEMIVQQLNNAIGKK